MIPFKHAVVDPAVGDERQALTANKLQQLSAIGVDGKKAGCAVRSTTALRKVHDSEYEPVVIDPLHATHVAIAELHHPRNLSSGPQIRHRKADAAGAERSGDVQPGAGWLKQGFGDFRILEEQLRWWGRRLGASEQRGVRQS